MPLPAAVTRLANFTQRQLDRLVPPESRQEAYTKARAFANQRPLLFSFIAVQALFAAMPILAFLNFLFFLVFWAATAALLFSMFWTLVATFILVPVLGIAFTAGLFFWTVGFVAFITGRTGFNGLRGIAATLDTQTDGTRPGEDNKEPRRAESAESSLSGLATSWANLDTQDIKQEEGSGSSSQTMPAHPDPGSDLDALEPWARSSSAPGPRGEDSRVTQGQRSAKGKEKEAAHYTQQPSAATETDDVPTAMTMSMATMTSAGDSLPSEMPSGFHSESSSSLASPHMLPVTRGTLTPSDFPPAVEVLSGTSPLTREDSAGSIVTIRGSPPPRDSSDP